MIRWGLLNKQFSNQPQRWGYMTWGIPWNGQVLLYGLLFMKYVSILACLLLVDYALLLNRLMCINEEDGLSFRVLQETTGGRHLQMLWDSKDVEDNAKLVDLLEESNLWPVYQLRATALVKDRVETQLAQLTGSEEEIVWITDQEPFNIGSQELHVATKLRTLEGALLEKAVEVLEVQVFLPPKSICPFPHSIIPHTHLKR